jgi:GNAT superfamily N-acetyltransferase
MAGDPGPSGTVKILQGLPEACRDAAAQLFWEAFRATLGHVMGPEDRALRFISRVMDPDHGIVALRADGVLLGLAGYKTASGQLVGGSWRDLRDTYGVWGASWRAPALSLLERPTEPDTLLMDGVVVAPEARGLGIGTLLLAAVKARATQLGKARVRLDVIDSNPRARSLYEREGFVAGAVSGSGPFAWLFGFRSATAMTFTVTNAQNESV